MGRRRTRRPQAAQAVTTGERSIHYLLAHELFCHMPSALEFVKGRLSPAFHSLLLTPRSSVEPAPRKLPAKPKGGRGAPTPSGKATGPGTTKPPQLPESAIKAAKAAPARKRASAAQKAFLQERPSIAQQLYKR